MAAFTRTSRHHAASWHAGWHAVERGFAAFVLIMLGFVAGALVATAATPVLESAQSAVRAFTGAEPAPVADLPREWRWERDATSYDGMIRPGASTRSLDHMYRTAR